MSATLIILCVFVVAADLIKLSLMPPRQSIPICVVWGVAMFFLTRWVSGVSVTALQMTLSDKNVLTGCFVEAFIFVAYSCSAGNAKTAVLLRYYPGLMMWLPLMLAAVGALRTFTGVGFTLISALSGLGVAAVSILFTLMARKMKTRGDMLYLMSLAILAVGIVIFGT